MLSTTVAPASATVAEIPAKLDKETGMLAALCYGEGSTNNVFEEMAALANVYGTIFWKLNPDYVLATGGVEYK